MSEQPAKLPAWDETLVNKVKTMYDPERTADSVKEISAETGRPARSIIAKLTSMGIYVKPVKAASTPKDTGPSKQSMLDELKDAGYDTDGLDGATKPAIQRLLAVVKE